MTGVKLYNIYWVANSVELPSFVLRFNYTHLVNIGNITRIESCTCNLLVWFYDFFFLIYISDSSRNKKFN